MWPYTWEVGLFVTPCLFMLGVSVSTYCIILPLLCLLILVTFHNVMKPELKIAILIATALSLEGVIFYNCIPLLWRQPEFIFFLLVCHFFIGNSVLYGLLPAEVTIPQREVLEIMSFTAFPGTCAVLLSWLLTVPHNVALFPYVLIGVSFLYFHYALWPRTSCYRRLAASTEPETTTNLQNTYQKPLLFGNKFTELIVEPVVVALLAITQALVPAMLFLLFNGVRTFKILTLPRLVESIFVFSLSVFTSTLLPVNIFVRSYDISQKVLPSIRGLSGLIVIALLSSVLSFHDVHSELLLRLKLKLVLLLLLAVTLHRRSLRLLSLCLTGTVVFVFGMQLMDFPWDFRYMPSDTLFIPKMYSLIYLCVGLSLALLWNLHSKQHKLVPLLVTTLFIVFHWCEWHLHSGHLVASSVLWMSSVPALYALLLLRRNGWLGVAGTSFNIALVVTKCLLLLYNQWEAGGARIHFGWLTYKAVFSLVLWSVGLPLAVTKDTRTSMRNVLIGLVVVGDVVASSVLLSFSYFATHLVRFDIFAAAEHHIGWTVMCVGICLCPLTVNSVHLHIKSSYDSSSNISNTDHTVKYLSIFTGPILVIAGVLELLLVFLVLETRLALIPIGAFVAAVCVLLWSWRFVGPTSASVMRYLLLAAFVLGFLLSAVLLFISCVDVELVAALASLLITTNTFTVVLIALLLPIARVRILLPQMTSSLLVNDVLASALCAFISSPQMARVIAALAYVSIVTASLAISNLHRRRQGDVNYVELTHRWDTTDLSNVCIAVATGLAIAACFVFSADNLALFTPLVLFLLRPSRYLRLCCRLDQSVFPRVVFTLVLLGLVWRHSYLLQPILFQRVRLSDQFESVEDVSDVQDESEFLFIPLHWHRWEQLRSAWELVVSVCGAALQLLHAWRRWNPHNVSAGERYAFHEVLLCLLLLPVELSVVLAATSSYGMLFGLFAAVTTGAMLLEKV